MTEFANTVIYSCPFVPAEFIAAYDLRPARIIPPAGATTPFHGTEGICPFARAFVNEAVTDKNAIAIVVTTMRDQMRKAHEIITAYCETPVFLLNVPTTRANANSTKLYIDETIGVLKGLVETIKTRLQAGTEVLAADAARIFWVNPVADSFNSTLRTRLESLIETVKQWRTK